MMGTEQFVWLDRELAKHDTPIVASSLPILQMPPFDRLMAIFARSEENLGLEDRQDRVDGQEQLIRQKNAESWFAFPRSTNRLLKLLAQRKTTFVLAGDVHYSYIYDVDVLTYVDPVVPTREAVDKRLVSRRARLLQIVSSPLQNEPTDKQFKEFQRFSGTNVVNEHGEPLPPFEFEAPGPHRWRDEYGNAVEGVWSEIGRPADPPHSTVRPSAYGTRNTIATMEWAEDGRVLVTFFGKDNTGRLAVIGQPKERLPAPTTGSAPSRPTRQGTP